MVASALPCGAHRAGSALSGGHACRVAALVCALAGMAGGCVPTLHAQANTVPAPGAPQQVRGTVTGDSGAVAGAIVHVTRGPDRLTLRTLTDSTGAFVVAFDSGTGDYLVHVAKEGFRAERRRLTGPAHERALEIAVRLTRSVAQLSAVRVQAQRPRPIRGDQASNQVGAAEQSPDDFGPLVLPDARGTITALAEATPGIVSLPSGFSVLGLPTDQNRVTLGGVGFEGGAVPRSLGIRSRLSTTSYDPALGWASGAQLAVDVFPGGLYSFRSFQVVTQPAAVQPARRDGTGFGARSSNVVVSGASGGPLGKRDRLFYAAGLDAHRRRVPATSFATASAADLRRGSIGTSDVDSLLAALSPWGLLPGRSDVSQVSEGATFLGRLDRPSRDPVSGAPLGQTFGLVGHLQLERRTGIGASPAPLRSLPSTWARGTTAAGMLQGIWSAYVRNDWLSETRSALSMSADRVRPDRELPSAFVQLRSDAPGSAGAVSDVRFGGGAELAAASARWSWETLHDTYFYAAAATRHRVKLSAGSRLEGYQARETGNAAILRYRSPADVRASTPDEFTYSAGLPRRSAAAWNGFLGLGDLWRVAPSFQLLGGVRLEGTAFLTPVPDIRDVRLALRTSTASTPGGIHISPRLGFQWSFRQGGGTQLRVTPLGRLGGGRTHFVRGGIGEFRQFVGSSVLDWPLATAGGSHVQVTCVGDRVPAIDWPGWSSGRVPVPAACGGEPDVQREPPTIHFLDPALQAPASWRANLAYSSGIGPALITVEGVYSWDRHQIATVDRNLRGQAAFMLSDEGRPVFAPSTVIVPASGAIDPRESREFPELGPILVRESTDGGRTAQLTIQAAPMMRPGSPWSASIAYTRSAARLRGHGLDVANFGDPRVAEWSANPRLPAHQVLAVAGVSGRRFGLALVGRLRSGLPYTPLILGDVNGDGVRNDRAFVFGAASGDALRDSATTALLAATTSEARRCLTAQSGRAAAANSCRGPWTVSADAQFVATLPVLPGGRTLRLGATMTNVLAGLDAAVHGSDGRGWGRSWTPDPYLYVVRGFDPARRQYAYDVNPRFGRSIARTENARPFRLVVDASFDIGTPLPVQQLDRWLRQGRNGYPGTRLSREALLQRYWRTVPDPYAALLAETDSLFLTSEQVRRLQALQVEFRAGAEQYWDRLVNYLASRGDRFDADEALRRQEATTRLVLAYAQEHVQQHLPEILSPTQLQVLPGSAASYYRARRGTEDGRTFRP